MSHQRHTFGHRVHFKHGTSHSFGLSHQLVQALGQDIGQGPTPFNRARHPLEVVHFCCQVFGLCDIVVYVELFAAFHTLEQCLDLSRRKGLE